MLVGALLRVFVGWTYTELRPFFLGSKLSRHTWPSASLPPAFTRCYRRGSMFTPAVQ